jgi:hypothetical protein
MGDMADMMLDGTMCEICGVYLEEGVAQGFPRKCENCSGKQVPRGPSRIVLRGWLPMVLMEAGLVSSASQGKQLIEQGGVRIAGVPVTDCSMSLHAGTHDVSVGTKHPKEARITIIDPERQGKPDKEES